MADCQGANLPDTDVQPADELGLAAVQTSLLLYRQSPKEAYEGSVADQEGYLVQAIVCLRYMLTRSPACAGAKFALVRLYRLIGEPHPSRSLAVTRVSQELRSRRSELISQTARLAQDCRNSARHAVTFRLGTRYGRCAGRTGRGGVG